MHIKPISFLQSFGIAEGGRVIEMKNMAKAAGQPLPEFTPPDGETMEQVKSLFMWMATLAASKYEKYCLHIRI